MPNGSIRCPSGIERALYDHYCIGCMYVTDNVSALRCTALKQRRLGLGFAIILLIALRAWNSARAKFVNSTLLVSAS